MNACIGKQTVDRCMDRQTNRQMDRHSKEGVSTTMSTDLDSEDKAYGAEGCLVAPAETHYNSMSHEGP